MAAYASLVSLMHVFDNLQLHPRPPISFDKDQVHLLTQKITFLQEFLEGYNPHLGYSAEADPLETRIANAAHAAEDLIEFLIMDQITYKGLLQSSDAVYRTLEKVIQKMALIEKEAMQIKQTVEVNHQLHAKSTPPDSSSSSSSTVRQSRMVGGDDVLLKMKDKLTSDRLNLPIIPIVGMGGSGKTTLARNIYQDRLIKEHFHIRAWITISQEYSNREILEQLLKQLDKQVSQDLRESELGDMLHKHLFGKKYLIVLDDMWNIEAWEGVRMFLPNNKKGSRVVITTRLSNLASKLPNSNSLDMKLLDEASSWDLLSKTVFGEEGCPLELEEIGKEIGKSCKGLPLSIVVVGGLLAKSEHKRKFWKYIEKNLSTIVNSEDDEHCLKILHMSYKQLPLYLKPCFLYMGVYSEDEVISVSMLIKLWVAEGFLKPVSGKSLEEIARLNLKELTNRNLVLIDKMGISGNIKQSKVHDSLRDMCLREAKKERFYSVIDKPHSPQGIFNGRCRRIVFDGSNKNDLSSSMLLVRSLTWNFSKKPPPLSFRLLRILYSKSKFPKNLHELTNSRFLALEDRSSGIIPSSVWLFWNLQTLIVDNEVCTAPSDFWYMPHIRHLHFEQLNLPDPPNSGDDDVVLENLQTLGIIMNFKCSEQVVKKIRNVKKLKVYYDKEVVDDMYGLNNLDCLDKLESFSFVFRAEVNGSQLMSLINFPYSLVKLNLELGESQYCQDIMNKIGALPLLQELKLEEGSFEQDEWKTSEGHFRSLKFLNIQRCDGLKVWTTESSHFPCLERLCLVNVRELEEIPLDFADIPTLQVLEVYHCRDSAIVSAKRIVEEQEELCGEATLQVKVKFRGMNEPLQRLASPNFHVTCLPWYDKDIL